MIWFHFYEMSRTGKSRQKVDLCFLRAGGWEAMRSDG